MFIKEIIKDKKKYDLHLEFIDGYYHKGKPTDEGMLVQELCFPSGENATYTENIKSTKRMSKQKSELIIHSLLYKADVLTTIGSLNRKIQERQEVNNYINAIIK